MLICKTARVVTSSTFPNSLTFLTKLAIFPDLIDDNSGVETCSKRVTRAIPRGKR